jgi:hypothetical protein
LASDILIYERNFKRIIVIALTKFTACHVTVWNEILAARFLKGKLNCQVGSEYTQNIALAA